MCIIHTYTLFVNIGMNVQPYTDEHIALRAGLRVGWALLRSDQPTGIIREK
jgi:hypothetical protein